MKTFKKFQIDYSLKNIPMPTKLEYQKTLTNKMNEFLVRCRWKLFWYKNHDKRGKERNTYGFKSSKFPSTDKDIKEFEDDMIELIKTIEMRSFTNSLQNQMNEDKRKIKNSPNIFLASDKTGNFYEVKPDVYQKFLNDTITKDYRKTSHATVENINKEAATIAAKMELDDRIEALPLNTSFLTVKDHKPTFPSKPSFRLINPSKPHLGKISKQILDRVNKDLKEKLMVNQWRSTAEVLEWFSSLDKKEELKFVQFDIESYYPSISQKLLQKALKLAREHTSLTEEEENIIIHSRKAVVADNSGQIWTKKEDPNFDVTMGALDGGECCEVVGLLILFMLKTIMEPSNCGLFRDDGLCVVRGGGQEAERMKKKIFSIFKQLDLNITVEANLTEVNFLDVSFNLADGSFRPFTKPNCSVKYVSKQSNHPPLILKNLPVGINTRLSGISSNKESFEEEKNIYQAALVEAGYNHKLEFKMDSMDGIKKRRRKQHILWFNPPFSCNIKTNVGKRFFSILQKHFPEEHELHHLFNKRTVKLSYSCMPAMKSIISSHNKKMLCFNKVEAEPGCNCQKGVKACPLDGKCQTQSLVYRAEVAREGGVEKEYLGQTNITFKLRWNNHKSECKLPHKEKATCLSKYVWYLKRKEINFTIKWSVASIASPYSRETGRCQLCTMERTLIALQDRGRGLNRRAEVLTRCWHKDKHLLTNWVGERPAPLSGQAGEEGGGAAVLHGDDGEGEGVPEDVSTLHGGNTNTVQDENIVSLGGGGKEYASQDMEDVERPPDQDQQHGGVEGGGHPAAEDVDIPGPVTRSRAKRKKSYLEIP